MRGRLLLGTIYRMGVAVRDGAPIRPSRPKVLRFVLRPADVASYALHPRSGSTRIDRATEAPNASEHRVVRVLDLQERPLFVLTPSRRIVRFEERVTTEVASRTSEPVIVAARQANDPPKRRTPLPIPGRGVHSFWLPSPQHNKRRRRAEVRGARSAD